MDHLDQATTHLEDALCSGNNRGYWPQLVWTYRTTPDHCCNGLFWKPGEDHVTAGRKQGHWASLTFLS